MHVCVTFTKETEQLLNIFAIKSLLIIFTDSKFFQIGNKTIMSEI